MDYYDNGVCKSFPVVGLFIRFSRDFRRSSFSNLSESFMREKNKIETSGLGDRVGIHHFHLSAVPPAVEKFAVNLKVMSSFQRKREKKSARACEFTACGTPHYLPQAQTCSLGGDTAGE